jgi:hypothetical protein
LVFMSVIALLPLLIAKRRRSMRQRKVSKEVLKLQPLQCARRLLGNVAVTAADEMFQSTRKPLK